MITLGTGVIDARHAKSVFWPYKFVGAELHVDTCCMDGVRIASQVYWMH